MRNIFLACTLFFWAHLIHAQSPSSVTGKITDESGEPLLGAVLLIEGSDEGAVTDINGNYTLTSALPFPWTIKVTYIGFSNITFRVTSTGDQGIISLSESILMSDEIIITASRISEKAVEAAASVTSINSRRIKVTPVNGDPTEYLRNVQGVTVVRAGTQSSTIELRGPINVLETSALVLKDYAPLTTSSDKILLTAGTALSPLDIARIEVVRGPSGALYGPNVTSGVVHYITRDAFSFPGISAMVSAGERNLFTSRVRYAANNGKKFGWKFLANYSHSTDFSIAEDQLIANDGLSRVVTPQDFETLGGKRWENIDNLDDIRLFNWNVEAGLEFRPTDNTKLNYTAGFSRSRTNRAIPIGHSLQGIQRFEQQLRLSSGNFFGTIYHRYLFPSVDKTGSPNSFSDYIFNINYTAGVEGETQFATPQTAEKYIDIALQYRIDVNENLDFQLGTDFKMSPAYEIEYIYGASSGDNAYNIFGGYLSGKYKFNEKLALNAAGRYDYFSAYEQSAFSPRVGLVFNPDKNSGARLSYSRSYEGQSRERTFLDFNFSSILPPFFPASRIVGVGQKVTYNGPVTRFAFGDVQGGESYTLQDIVNALAINAGVAAPTVSGAVDPVLTTAHFASPGVGFSTGTPISLDEAGLDPPTLRTVNQVELGYGNTINQKFKFNVDVYNTWIENIQPTGEVPLTAGAQLDVAAVQALIEQQVPAGPDRDALIASLNSVPFNPTPNPGFDGTPGFGAVMSDRAQQYGYIYDIGFPTYGNKKVSYYGAELSGEYFLTPDLSIFANYSFISKTIWSAEDLQEKNPEYKYYLNTAPDRINLGVNYFPLEGFYGSLAMNYQSEYEGRQGDGRFFTGINEARSIFDLQAGYRLTTSNNVRFDLGLSINNLFDKKYSHFIHLPQLRRFSALTLKVSL